MIPGRSHRCGKAAVAPAGTKSGMASGSAGSEAARHLRTKGVPNLGWACSTVQLDPAANLRSHRHGTAACVARVAGDEAVICLAAHLSACSWPFVSSIRVLHTCQVPLHVTKFRHYPASGAACYLRSGLTLLSSSEIILVLPQ